MSNITWREKRLLSQDETIQSFDWPYTTAELINELSMVDEIMELRSKLEQPTEMREYLRVDMCFEEAFIDSHELLVQLLDRVTTCWNANMEDDKHLATSFSLMSYKHAIKIFKTSRAALLRMRSIYEQLKPETQVLTKLCSSKTQLHNSMLAQRKNVASSVEEDKSSDILKHLQERVRCIHEHMHKLQMEKDIQEAIRDAVQVSDVLSSILQDGMLISDATVALAYATDTIAPQRNDLQRYGSCFDNTLKVFPDIYPSSFTKDEALDFFVDMREALAKDKQNLMVLTDNTALFGCH